MVIANGKFCQIANGTIWNMILPNDDLDWRLRYAKKENLTREELLRAASIIESYKTLLQLSQKERNWTCQQIKHEAAEALRQKGEENKNVTN
jgi:hypothetical protein